MFSLASPCRSLRDTGNPVAEVPPGLLELRAGIVVPSHARREFSLESWVILPEMEWASVTPGSRDGKMFQCLAGYVGHLPQRGRLLPCQKAQLSPEVAFLLSRTTRWRRYFSFSSPFPLKKRTDPSSTFT